MGFKSREKAGQSIRVISSLSSSCRISAVQCGRTMPFLRNEVRSNSTSEQTYMGKEHVFTITISGYRTSLGNVELIPPVPHNTSPDDNSTATVIVSFCDVTAMKQSPGLFLNQLALKIAFGTETTTLILKEGRIQLMRCPIFVLLIPV
ncbi:hypothetical protein TNCV_3809011 [Trichonephila clavipes]|nr:hypothetical protein TNCV_3809011 [Trichonephila clavipes]